MKIATTISDSEFAALENGDAIEITVWAPVGIRDDVTVVEVSSQETASMSTSAKTLKVNQLKAERLDSRGITVTLATPSWF